MESLGIVDDVESGDECVRDLSQSERVGLRVVTSFLQRMLQNLMLVLSIPPTDHDQSALDR